MVKNITLARKIKWVIGNRIILCLGLLSITILAATISDIYDGVRQNKNSLDNESRNISEFIIAQSLINNPRGISLKLNELNQSNPNETIMWQPKSNLNKQADIEWRLPLSWIYKYPVRDNEGNPFGVIQVSGCYLYDRDILVQLTTKICLLLFFSGTMFLLLYPLSSRIPQDLFITPIMNLLVLLKSRSSALEKSNNITLPLELREIQCKIIDLINEVSEQSRKIAVGQIATQVAHDIRSPLTVLDIVVKDILAIPENQRILIRNATTRIHDIANNLLTFNDNSTFLANEDLENSAQLLADLLSSVVSEKRTQYKNLSITFVVNIEDIAHSAFANVSAPKFCRVISNLLNNAVESMLEKNDGIISIKLNLCNERIMITIQDTGSGIPPNILRNVIAGKIVTQKEKGHGLGLSYSIKTVEKSWSGELKIKSTVGKGTIIEINLPLAPAPIWFAKRISIAPKTMVVILDDDITIHQVWLNRFNEIDSSFSIKEFHNPSDLIYWHKDNISQNNIFLIDYELIGSNYSGIDVIKKLNISHCSYLVTSRYQEVEIRRHCEEIGIRLIPKHFAPHIPIFKIFENELNPDVIFIDDNEILTNAWKLRGELVGMKIATFNSIAYFKLAMNNYYNKDVAVYVDFDLQTNVSGLDFTKEIHARGFRNIYLSTGYPASHFGHMPWIRAIVGKEPPF